MKIKNSDHGGDHLYISDFFEGAKVKFNQFIMFISKQIPNFVSLNTIVLESIKIY